MDGMTELLAQLDDGPACSVFSELGRLCEGKISPSLLEFGDSFRHRAAELSDLISKFHEKKVAKCKRIPEVTINSVAKWIYCSNHIEGAGLSEGDTKSRVCGKVLEEKGVGVAEVDKTLDLLKQTYKADVAKFTANCFDVPKLLKWHSILFSGILPVSGQLRKSGACSTDQSGATHKFPHHQFTSGSLPNSI